MGSRASTYSWLLWLLLPGGCREPTQITLEITTDALCSDVNETIITVGRLQGLDGQVPSTVTTRCESGRIGSIVLVPSGSENGPVAVQVVTALGDETGDSCAASKFSSGCIVARRALRYYPHEPLALPVFMNLACKDKPCSELETCFDGRCVEATLPDARRCATPGGCTQVDSGAGGMAPVDASVASGGATGSGGSAGTGGIADGGGGVSDAATGGTVSSGGMGGTVSSGGIGGLGGVDASKGGTGGLLMICASSAECGGGTCCFPDADAGFGVCYPTQRGCPSKPSCQNNGDCSVPGEKCCPTVSYCAKQCP